MANFLKRYKQKELLTNEELEKYKIRSIELKNLIVKVLDDIKISPSKENFNLLSKYTNEISNIRKILSKAKKEIKKNGK